jgi:pilus assembly protein Flp/PilA
MRHPFRIAHETKAATSVEYGLIVALIFLAIAAAVSSLATSTTGMWNNVSNEIRNA